MLNEGDTFKYQGKDIEVLVKKDIPLSNNLQQQHIDGELDVYAPVEAYAERWTHKSKKTTWGWDEFISAEPMPKTRKRADLPSIATQWKNTK